MNPIAAKIKEARKSKGLSQEELANLAKLNLRTIQRIENEKNEPRGKTLNLICEALEIDASHLISSQKSLAAKGIFFKIIDGVFILIINLVVVGIIGFLTLDVNANANSLFGGVLLSFFIPMFIVFFTRKMNDIERLLKFGFGCMLYFIIAIFLLGLPIAITTGLLPCLVICLFFLYFGSRLLSDKK